MRRRQRARDQLELAAEGLRGVVEAPPERAVAAQRAVLPDDDESFATQRRHRGEMLVVGGGLPVLADGDVVGAIGVSSGTPMQDREVAQAGIDCFQRE